MGRGFGFALLVGCLFWLKESVLKAVKQVLLQGFESLSYHNFFVGFLFGQCPELCGANHGFMPNCC